MSDTDSKSGGDSKSEVSTALAAAETGRESTDIVVSGGAPMPNQIEDLAETSGGASRTKPYILTGILAIFLLLGGMVTWSALASIAGAVIASGVIAVESKSKDVQHLQGGIVGEILVRDGDRVKGGQLLVRLDDKMLKANLAITENQLIELVMRQARLEAERDGADEIRFPDMATELADKVTRDRVWSGQINLFKARTITRTGQIEQYSQSIVQYEDQIHGLEAQRKSRDEQLVLINQEVKNLEKLYKRGHTPITRLLALKRQAASLHGERGSMISSIAQARAAIGETKLRILQIDTDFREQVLTELRDVQVRVAELMERRVATLEQLSRTEIRAPTAGLIHGMTVHTIGGVVSPAAMILKIVPDEDRLIVEAQVEPQFIDQVHIGQPAVLRFVAFNQRTTPELNGVVIKVSADRLFDPVSGGTFYLAKAEVSEKELSRLKGVELVPGMPVEMFIKTEDRTALSYLLKPFTDQLSLAFREE